MPLIRVVRPPPDKPTREKLQLVLKKYAIRRVVCARLMRVSQYRVDCYLLPESSTHHAKIPQSRWELLLMKVQSIYHPDEEIEFTL